MKIYFNRVCITNVLLHEADEWSVLTREIRSNLTLFIYIVC
jgi:hypothetical protein